MDNVKYEEKIAALESDLQNWKEAFKRLENSQEANLARALGNREILYRNLLMFMQSLYERLAEVQSELLSNMGTLHTNLNETNKARMGATMAATKKLIGITTAEIEDDKDED